MNDLGKFKRYRIGGAAQELGVKTSVLRFWESEFEQLEPVRSASGQRLYTEKHLALLRLIKSLLYDEGLTLEGARKRLAESQHCTAGERQAPEAWPRLPLPAAAAGVTPPSPASAPVPDTAFLREVAAELRSILKLMTAPE